MRLLIHLLMAIAIALGLGFGLSYYALTDGRLLGARMVGPWAVWPAVGVTDPDPYTRAYLARRGQLQLGRSEGLRFVAETDSAGKALNAACSYRVDGKTPQASLWTLVALDRKGRNIARPGTPLFMDDTHLQRGPDGTFSIDVGPDLSGGDWLETEAKGSLRLVLTLYDTPVPSGRGEDGLAMPTITKAGCL